MFLKILPAILVPKLILRLRSGQGLGTRRWILFLVNVLALTTSACAAPESINTKAGQAILAHTWQIDQHIIWEIEWPAAPMGGALTVETWRAGERYRFEILESTAPDLVGQTLIFDGQTAWRYNRFEAKSPASSLPPLLPPISDAFAIITRLTTTAPETATQEAVQLSHGPTQKITLSFDTGDSLTLWRDQATGLPTRIIFVVGGQQAMLRARSFEPLLDLPEGLFKP